MARALALSAALTLGAGAGLGGCRARETPPSQGAAPAQAIPAATEAAAAAAASIRAPAVAPDPELPLGAAELAALGWRERGGQEAFRRARAAERRGDWAAMVAQCQEALAADATHLEASWLLAAGLSHLRRFSEVGAPLLLAVAGDPAKWALPALQLPLFAPYWASGQGDGLRPWLVALEGRLGAALARSAILLHRGRLLAYDRQTRRFLPLTRRLGILGALVGKTRISFVALPRGRGPGKKPEALLGSIERRSGALHEVALPEAMAAAIASAIASSSSSSSAPPSAGPAGAAASSGARFELVDVAEAAAAQPQLRVRVDRGPWQALDGEQLSAAPAPPRQQVPRLVIAEGRAQLVRLPLAGVVADWDQAAMASALRIRRSNRLVALPAPALIDGQRVLWSPGGAHLALVASLEDCEREPPAEPSRRALAYVVDPITGAAREVAQSAGGLELDWVAPGVLALASDRGLELLDLASGDVEHLDGELSLGAPLRPSRCAPPPPLPEPPLRPGDDLDDL